MAELSPCRLIAGFGGQVANAQRSGVRGSLAISARTNQICPGIPPLALASNTGGESDVITPRLRRSNTSPCRRHRGASLCQHPVSCTKCGHKLLRNLCHRLVAGDCTRLPQSGSICISCAGTGQQCPQWSMMLMPFNPVDLGACEGKIQAFGPRSGILRGGDPDRAKVSP
jgi:hypothetical protein